MPGKTVEKTPRKFGKGLNLVLNVSYATSNCEPCRDMSVIPFLNACLAIKDPCAWRLNYLKSSSILTIISPENVARKRSIFLLSPWLKSRRWNFINSQGMIAGYDNFAATFIEDLPGLKCSTELISTV